MVAFDSAVFSTIKDQHSRLMSEAKGLGDCLACGYAVLESHKHETFKRVCGCVFRLHLECPKDWTHSCGKKPVPTRIQTFAVAHGDGTGEKTTAQSVKL